LPPPRCPTARLACPPPPRPPRRGRARLPAWAHAPRAAQPAGLLGPRHRSISRPATSTATAACTPLWASTPIVIIAPSFFLAGRARAPGGQGSLGSPWTRLL